MTTDVRVAMRDGEVMDLAGALLVYRGGKNVFVTIHDAIVDGGTCELSSGTPVTREAAATLLQGLELAVSFKGFLPERLLAIAPGAMVWWCPPSKRTVWFDSDKMGTRHGVVSHPGLVFAAHGDQWFVFAVKGDRRPTPETRLCRAPYFNVWADRGEICTGNVGLPSPTGPEAMDAYETAFFGSRFTHPNPGFKVRYRGGGYALWTALLEAKGSKPFPYKAIVPTKFTLAQLVTQITERKDDGR